MCCDRVGSVAVGGGGVVVVVGVFVGGDILFGAMAGGVNVVVVDRLVVSIVVAAFVNVVVHNVVVVVGCFAVVRCFGVLLCMGVCVVIRVVY